MNRYKRERRNSVVTVQGAYNHHVQKFRSLVGALLDCVFNSDHRRTWEYQASVIAAREKAFLPERPDWLQASRKRTYREYILTWRELPPSPLP